MVPSTSNCYKLWDTYNLPQKKRIHSKIIAQVAQFLGKKLTEKGIHIDLDLLSVACLLHDIDKAVDKKPGEQHPESAVRLLRDEKLHDVAEVVRTHSLHCMLDAKTKPTTWEQKLLYLADKMVKYELVGVNKRFELWRKEQMTDEAEATLVASYPKVKALERDIYVQCESSFSDITSAIT